MKCSRCSIPRARRERRARPKAGLMGTLRGQLQSISLVDVLQLLHSNRKTGELLVSRGPRSGILHILNGEVVHAETGKARGEGAAFDILAWDQGEFEFIATSVKTVPTIQRSVPDLLMEAARITDSRNYLSAIFPDLDLVPWPTLGEPQLTAGLRLFAEDRPVLGFLNGYRSLREVIADSSLSDVSVLQVCANLQAAGRMDLLDPAHPVAVTALKAGFFQRGGQVRLARSHELRWQAQGPYGANPLTCVRIARPQGSVLAQVQFVKDLADETIGIPRELMQSWELPEATMVSIRPALRPLTT